MAKRRIIYTGKINKERTGVVPDRGQGISQYRSIKFIGGRKLLVHKNLRTGFPVKFMFPVVKDRSTQYNYFAELVD